MSEPIISVEHVSKSVTDSTGTLDILRDIDFSLAARETAAIVGASGSGKSTLLSIIAGLYQSVSKSHKTALVPFMLKGVADGPDALRLFQADRLHPTEAAQTLILDNIWPELKKLLPAPVAAGIAGS
jgi:ABC-type nitrate/sulfonate/bicarbonate transport system ATPase subunit